MFLRELTVENLRSIENARICFQTDTGDARKWTLVLGENGCGKSTLLRAAALVLVGSDALPPLLGEIDSWIHYDAKEARVSATIVTAEGEERKISLVLRRGVGVREMFEQNRDTLERLDNAIRRSSRNYLSLGYGASRRLNNEPEHSFKRLTELPARARAVATLFSADASLEPLESWVIDMDYQKRVDAAGLIRRIASELMPQVEFHSIDKQRKQLLFKTPDGVTPLARLSDGYQNVAAWCGDLLRSVTTIFDDYENPLSARGLLLVDEIDLHLHPVWQRRLRSFFDRVFPNLQFVATTHSALTVQQAGEGELHVMKRPGSVAAPIVEQFAGAPNKMMTHQLLLSPIFNIDSMDSLEVERTRDTYRKLKSKPRRSTPEEAKLTALETSIRELPDLAAGLSKFQERQTRVLEKIHSTLRTNRAIKPARKAGRRRKK